MRNLDDLFSIDQRSRAIAEYPGRGLVCLAGPGTGKTYSFLERIKALTTHRGIALNEICYLTFINAIADAFREDYVLRFPPAGGADTTSRISTLHSFSCRLLKHLGHQVGYDGALYFLNSADKGDDRVDVFLGDSLPLVEGSGLRTSAQLRNCVSLVKKAWQSGHDPSGETAPIPLVAAKCITLGRAYRLLDWDFTIPLAHELLRTSAERPDWICRLKHYMIDEHQDLNPAEQDFLETLLETAESWVIVGDDDQSVYSNRGGSPDGLRALYNDSAVDKVTMTLCRRCKVKILDAANKFLVSMKRDPRPMVHHEEGGRVDCLVFKSAKAELAYLVQFLHEQIAALPPDGEIQPKHGIVCLFPSRKMLDFYMGLLKSKGVPCYSRRQASPQERTRLARALELVQMPHRRFSERLLLEEYSGIRREHKKAMVRLAIEQDLSPADALGRLVAEGMLTGKAKENAELFRGLCAILSSQDATAISAALGSRLGISPDVVHAGLDPFLASLGAHDVDDGITEACDRILPATAVQPEDMRAVLCLTMHGSKGLTRRTVVMPGFEAAHIPGDADATDLPERKRLFYVALTRATDRVLMTVPRTRARGDPFNFEKVGRGQPSPFVLESGIRAQWAS